MLFSTRHPAPRATLPGGCRGPHNTGSLRSDPTARVAFAGDVVKRERSYFHFRSGLLSSTPCSSGLVPLLPFNLIKSTFAESVLWGCDTVGNLMMKETKGKPARLKHNRISEIKIFIKLYGCNWTQRTEEKGLCHLLESGREDSSAPPRACTAGEQTPTQGQPLAQAGLVTRSSPPHPSPGLSDPQRLTEGPWWRVPEPGSAISQARGGPTKLDSRVEGFMQQRCPARPSRQTAAAPWPRAGK